MAAARAKPTKRPIRRAKRSVPPRAPPPPLAIAAATLLLVACTVPILLSGDPYPGGTVRYWLLGGACVVAAAALGAALTPRAIGDLTHWCGEALRRPPPFAFATIVAATTTALSLVFGVYAFEQSSTTSDELAQLWHAKMLVHGRLFLPPDPNPEFFAFENVIDEGRWYSQFPIGGPLVLATGMLFGVPWLVNPVLAGVAAAAMYHFARHAYGETQGRAIAALFCLTPLVLIMAGTYMNHVSVLCLAACALAALVEWERTTSRRRAVAFAALVGIALGAMVTIRPLDGVIAAVVVGLFQLAVVRRDLTRARELGVQAVAGVVAVAPLLYANWATTGSAGRFGYDVIWGRGHRVGFHADPLGGVHTLGRALEYAMTYVNALNVYLMAWPVPALLVAIAGLLAMRRTTRWDALLLGLCGAQVAAYASYWGVGDFLGPRFLFTALPAIVVLLARAPFLVADRYGGRWRAAAVSFTLACVVVAWATPTVPNSVWGLATQARRSRRVLKVDLAGAVRDAGLHHALVFLRDPFDARLLRRLWGLGVTRSDAAQLLETSDACSLLSAVGAAEADSSMPRVMKEMAVMRATAPYAPDGRVVRTGNPAIRISEASLTAPCRTELDDDARLGNAPFGPALPLEPIGADGHIDGDVIYAADLGERNRVLQARFGDRAWHRLSIQRSADGALRPMVRPY